MLCFRRSEHKSCAKRASPSSSGGPLTCQQTNGGDVDTHDCSRATRNRCSKRLPSYFVDQGWELSTPSCVRTTHDLALLEHPKGFHLKSPLHRYTNPAVSSERQQNASMSWYISTPVNARLPPIGHQQARSEPLTYTSARAFLDIRFKKDALSGSYEAPSCMPLFSWLSFHLA